jgi:hypothetical protein
VSAKSTNVSSDKWNRCVSLCCVPASILFLSLSLSLSSERTNWLYQLLASVCIDYSACKKQVTHVKHVPALLEAAMQDRRKKNCLNMVPAGKRQHIYTPFVMSEVLGSVARSAFHVEARTRASSGAKWKIHTSYQ